MSNKETQDSLELFEIFIGDVEWISTFTNEYLTTLLGDEANYSANLEYEDPPEKYLKPETPFPEEAYRATVTLMWWIREISTELLIDMRKSISTKKQNTND